LEDIYFSSRKGDTVHRSLGHGWGGGGRTRAVEQLVHGEFTVVAVQSSERKRASPSTRTA